MSINVAIVDYGMGNLFSVRQACNYAGLNANITSNKNDILSAEAVILPGVGAFGDAMKALRQLDLIGPLKEVALSPRPFLGICLGMHLLMSESYEFGHHCGLGLIKGDVIRFENPVDSFSRKLKVPQVGWNRIYRVGCNSGNNLWEGTILSDIKNGEFMYFVHSYYARPEDKGVILSISRYGNIEFCSSLRYQNIYACQFHPERSGLSGLKIYQNLSSIIKEGIRCK